MAEQVKVLTAKPGDLSSNPEPAWWKKRLIPILLQHEHTHIHTQMDIINTQLILKARKERGEGGKKKRKEGMKIEDRDGSCQGREGRG